MKRKPTGLSQRYVATLRKNLKDGADASLRPALRLGRQAAALGMETLGLARMHEQALIALALPKAPPRVLKRAEIFLSRHSPRLWQRIARRGNTRLTWGG